MFPVTIGEVKAAIRLCEEKGDYRDINGLFDKVINNPFIHGNMVQGGLLRRTSDYSDHIPRWNELYDRVRNSRAKDLDNHHHILKGLKRKPYEV